MMYFKGLSAVDRVRFEGREVHKIVPIYNGKSKELTHYTLSVQDDAEGAVIRKFSVDEIPHLIDAELLEVDRGYHSIPRQVDRSLYDGQELYGASRKERAKVDRMVHLAKRMEHYHTNGMVLTPEGVSEFRHLLDGEYQRFQARAYYGTDRPNASQRRYPLPANTTLLDYFRRFRRAQGNPSCFLVPKKTSPDLHHQMTEDFAFTMQLLSEYASEKKPAKSAIAARALEIIQEVNENRKSANFPILIAEKSVRTYERWIDIYLDPFTVVMKRLGLAAARKKFKTSEQKQHAQFPGQIVQFDAWMFHIVTLDVSRKRWLAMSEEERKRVKRVRRWIVVAIDVATRCILGFSICKAPNERSAIEAMRMCYEDKTYLLRDAKIEKSTWNFVARHHMTVTDSGSEFGKHPFGGSMFVHACRTLSGSLMNTAAGIPELRGHIERFFFTCELKFAREVPGWTASNPSALNDRKPRQEACLTDDDLAEAVPGVFAEYHSTPHRGLGFKTPEGVWAEMTAAPEFDRTSPGPRELREACGFLTTAKMGENGIRFARNSYSNEFIRGQRMAPGKDRIADVGDTVEIMVDPFNLGAISVVTPKGMVSVKCTNRDMSGKTLRQADRYHEVKRLEAQMDAAAHSDQRKEAGEAWREVVARASRLPDVGIVGYTDAEIDRARREMGFGKGLHEERFVGRDEYRDPIMGGLEIGEDEEFSEVDGQFEVKADAPSSMDRFRSNPKGSKRRVGRNQEGYDQ